MHGMYVDLEFSEIAVTGRLQHDSATIQYKGAEQKYYVVIVVDEREFLWRFLAFRMAPLCKYTRLRQTACTIQYKRNRCIRMYILYTSLCTLHMYFSKPFADAYSGVYVCRSTHGRANATPKTTTRSSGTKQTKQYNIHTHGRVDVGAVRALVGEGDAEGDHFLLAPRQLLICSTTRRGQRGAGETGGRHLLPCVKAHQKIKSQDYYGAVVPL